MSIESSWLAGEVHHRVRSSLDQVPSGTVFPQETLIACWPEDPDHTRKPDMVFVRKSRLSPDRRRRGAIRVTPDLVAEVVSPHDEAGAVQVKLADYRRAGIPMVWVIYPETRDAYVYRSDRPDSSYVPPGGALDGGEILPGFRLSLVDLFAASDVALG